MKRANPYYRVPKIIDGVECWPCTNCPEGSNYKPVDAFYRAAKCNPPIKSRCKECERKRAVEAYWQDPEFHRRKGRLRSADRRRYERDNKRTMDAAHRRDMAGASKRILIPHEVAKPWVDALVSGHESVAHAARAIATGESHLHKFYNEQRYLSYDLADRIVMELGRHRELNEYVASLSDIPQWHAKHEHCQGCGTRRHPHHAKGMCRRCYKHDYNGSATLPWDQQSTWSPYAPHCRRCDRNDRPHHARGLCGACYSWCLDHKSLDSFPPVRYKGKS